MSLIMLHLWILLYMTETSFVFKLHLSPINLQLVCKIVISCLWSDRLLKG